MDSDDNPKKGTLDDLMDEVRAEDPELGAAIDAYEPIVLLAQALVKMRKLQGRTQREIAEAIGVKQSAIARLEGGDRDPRWTTIHQAVSALDYQIKFIPVHENVVLVTEDQMEEFADAKIRAVFDVLKKAAMSEALTALGDIKKNMVDTSTSNEDPARPVVSV
jgi:predicted transcriptional regulator